nr:YjdF family protein [Paenibacillus larvae]
MKLTVLYDGQFWIGVIEWEEGARFKAGRYIFGAEPKDEEVLEFVNQHMMKLVEQITASIPIEQRVEFKVNPKRMIRETKKETSTRNVSSKAQQAMKEELELRKKQRIVESKERREEINAYKREVARQKAKAKHRGR